MPGIIKIFKFRSPIFIHLLIINLVLLLTFCSADLTFADREISWIESPENAYLEAMKSNRPILVNFYSKDCAPCIKMKKELFPLKKFHAFIDQYHLIPLIINTDIDHSHMDAFVKNYGINGLPTILLLDYRKNEIGRSEGYRSALLTIRQLEKIIENRQKLDRL